MKSICLWLALLVSASPVSWGATPAPPPKISGIYSDLVFNNEGGDLLGIELMIVPRESKGDLAWSAFVQVAEGGAPQTALAPLALIGNKLECGHSEDRMAFSEGDAPSWATRRSDCRFWRCYPKLGIA
jgi:hypothetical protein